MLSISVVERLKTTKRFAKGEKKENLVKKMIYERRMKESKKEHMKKDRFSVLHVTVIHQERAELVL